MGKIIEELKTIGILAVIAFGGLYVYYSVTDIKSAWRNTSSETRDRYLWITAGCSSSILTDSNYDENTYRRINYGIYQNKKLSDMQEQKVVECARSMMNKYSPSDLSYLLTLDPNDKEVIEFRELFNKNTSK
jgi:hypothetical protein